RQLRLSHRPLQANERLHARNDPAGLEIEQRIDLFGPTKPNASIAHDLESSALKRIAASNGVELADESESLACRFRALQTPADGDVHIAKVGRSTRRSDVVAAQRQIARYGDSDIELNGTE